MISSPLLPCLRSFFSQSINDKSLKTSMIPKNSLKARFLADTTSYAPTSDLD